MLLREARELFVAKLSEVEGRKMLVTADDEIGQIAILGIKIGTYTVLEAVDFYIKSYWITGFRC